MLLYIQREARAPAVRACAAAPAPEIPEEDETHKLIERLIFMTRAKRRIEINVFIANLGKYNEGNLIGDWFDLFEATDEEIAAVIGNDCEYIILDFEAPDFFKIHEFSNIQNLRNQAEAIEEIDPEIMETFIYHGYTIEEAIEKIENDEYNVYNDCDDMTDVAYQVIEESGMLSEAPELVQRYFDYEAFGRDLDLEGYFYKISNGYIEIIS